MKLISDITPNGQVTIPRAAMKLLGIREGSEVRLKVENGMIVINKIDKIEKRRENQKNSFIVRAV